MLGGIKCWTLEFCMPLAIVVDGMHEVQANVDGSIKITIPSEASACNAVAAANASLGTFLTILTHPFTIWILLYLSMATRTQFGCVVFLHNDKC